MFESMSLAICGFIFLSFIMVIYFSKKLYNNLENGIYRFSLILTLFLLLLEIACVITMANRTKIPVFNEILCRIYLLGAVIWFFSLILYVWCLGKNGEYHDVREVLKKPAFIVLILFAIMAYAFTCFFSITYTSGPSNHQLYVIGGKAVYVLYLLSALLIYYLLYTLTLSKRNVPIIKRLPIFGLLLVYLVLGVWQFLNIDFNDLTFVFAVCLSAMYFTLENQDYKLVSELEKATVEAEKADKAKTEFLSTMSHEIRTPMNAIMGFSESLMQDNNYTLDKVKQDSKYINEASVSLLNIINNILQISRLESGKETKYEKEYFIGNMIYELNSVIGSKVDRHNIDFVINVDKNIPDKLMGDETKIYQILLNLLDNAVKFTKTGKVELSVKYLNISAQNEACLAFIVTDTGCGIKKENFNKLFKQFSRFSSDDILNTGTGLGLVIVKHLVDLLNGSITFDSTFGEGSSFKVELKQKIISSKPIGKLTLVKIDQDNINYYFDCHGKRVLLIDDNSINLKLAEKLLASYNLRVTSVLSGELGIEEVKKNNKFDLILVDHLMPNMDGIETMHIIKNIDNKIPVVVLTANEVTGIRDSYIKDGFDDYLSKPINIRELSKMLKKYIK